MKKIIYSLGKSSNTANTYFTESDFRSPSFDYESTKFQISTLKSIQKMKIDSESLTSIFTYEGISFWWLFLS